MSQILIQDDFATEQECKQLKKIYDNHCNDSAVVFSKEGRLVIRYWHLIKQNFQQEANFFAQFGNKGLERVKQYFEIPELYINTIILATHRVSERSVRHADSEKFENSSWGPNHTPRRHYSSLLYLNDDFEGGEIYFEQHSLMIKPHRGLFIAFPSNRFYIHEVFPVSKGVRYSFPMWFTYDKDQAIDSKMIIDSEAIHENVKSNDGY